ncbi:MAG: hypothetical protein ACLSCA_23655, partial [[Clostridium] symbiosum]
ENKTTVSPSPSSDAKPPGGKTHKTIPPPRPLACGGVLTCLFKSCILSEKALYLMQYKLTHQEELQ